MAGNKVTITFTDPSIKTPTTISGSLPREYNNPESDFYIVVTDDGKIVDIPKRWVNKINIGQSLKSKVTVGCRSCK